MNNGTNGTETLRTTLIRTARQLEATFPQTKWCVSGDRILKIDGDDCLSLEEANFRLKMKSGSHYHRGGFLRV